MIRRTVAVLLAGAIVLGGPVGAPARAGSDGSGPADVRRAGVLADGTAPSATPSGSESSSPSPGASGSPNPLGSGVGIVVLLVIGGAFLWFRGRALRR